MCEWNCPLQSIYRVLFHGERKVVRLTMGEGTIMFKFDPPFQGFGLPDRSSGDGGTYPDNEREILPKERWTDPYYDFHTAYVYPGLQNVLQARRSRVGEWKKDPFFLIRIDVVQSDLLLILGSYASVLLSAEWRFLIIYHFLHRFAWDLWTHCFTRSAPPCLVSPLSSVPPQYDSFFELDGVVLSGYLSKGLWNTSICPSKNSFLLWQTTTLKIACFALHKCPGQFLRSNLGHE